MSTPELDEMEALLGQVLPDPLGFTERLLQQMVIRWAEVAPSEGAGLPDMSVDADPEFEAESVLDEYEMLIDSNILLAAALGACHCWGLKSDCFMCNGQGSAGWKTPDADLFKEYIDPAVSRLTQMAAGLEATETVQREQEVETAQPNPGKE